MIDCFTAQISKKKKHVISAATVIITPISTHLKIFEECRAITVE